MLRNTLRLDFCYSKIIHIPPDHPKIIGHILKIKQKSKCACIHEIIQLIIIKMEMKMKIRSHRQDINRPRPIHGHKYSKYRKCLSMIMLICIKQHLSNIHFMKKLSSTLAGLKTSLAYKKSVCSNYIHRYCAHYTV